MFSPSDFAFEIMSLAERFAFLVICEALFFSLILEITSPKISPNRAAPAPINMIFQLDIYFLEGLRLMEVTVEGIRMNFLKLVLDLQKEIKQAV